MEEDLAYDKVQAKFCASLLWFVCRISEQNEASSIPSEITSPIEISEEHILMVRPAIVEYLISGEMYFSVAQAIFNENMQSFWDLLQLMSLNAIYILDENGDPVTNYDLAEKFPFKMSAHLALMDCLMLAYANNIVSLEDLVACVKRISTFNASKELPFDLENAVLLWLNKVNYVNSGNFGRVREPKLKPKGANEPIRVRKDQLVERNVFPRLHNLLETLHDGKTLLSILLYYSPDTINIEDIKLSSVLSEDEKISNIELFRRLCAENVCTSVFALRIEDFYFRNDFMKNNFLALLCEVFVKMESMTKRNIANIVTSDSNVKSKTIEPFCEKTSPEKTARPFQQQKLPLLSKRSKQQLAIFEASLSRDVPPPTKDVHVHDLELQESVTVSSTVAMDKTETARSIAWGPQESKKSAKISLDFKPEMGVMQHSQKSFSMEDCCQPGMETIKSNRRGNYINKSQNEAFHSIINHAKENVNSAYPSAVHGDDHAVSDVEQDYEGRELTSHQNFQPARDLSTSCDLATDYKKIRSMYSLIPIETDPLTAGESVSSLPSAGEESDSSLVFASASVGTKVDLEDDALSTITEATEPEPDSHHVPLQSSANSFYAQNLVNDELESNQLPEFTAGVEATERMDDVNTEKSPFSRCVLGNASACLPGKKEIQTDNETGMSYTIDDGTLEEAIASGIPIIAKTELHNNSTSSKTYFDLNSSQEISVMQSDVSLPTGSFCGSETMHIHVDTKASYDADVRLQYSKSMLSHSLINGSNLDVHMQTIENNKKNDIFVESLNNTKENYTKSAVKGDKNYKPSPPEMDDIFSSISYEHWPFIKEFSKNNFTLRKNGRDMICERLNNTKNDNHGQLYTSWSDQSKKNAYFSLEARESRLQQIRERRLNWTAKCTKHPTTSWAEISLQRQKLAEGRKDVPLSSRLAALRMQLEEKRRQFEEEKKRKLKEWREERAETLQNTFFVSFDGKENIDPTDNKPVSSDDQTALPTRSRSSSVKEFIHQKQLEKSISKKTLTSENNSENTWFVDFKGGEQQEGRVNALAPPDPPEDTAIPTSLHSSNTFIDDKLTKRDEGVADEEPAEAPTTVDIVTGNQDLDEEMREETTQPATVAQAMEVVEKREEANINDEKIVDIHSPSILTSANMGIVENIESSLAKMNLNVVEVTDTNENKEFVPPIHSSTITQLPVPFPGEQEKKQDKVATSLSDVIINEELPEEQHTEIKQDITTAETSEVKELLEETPPKPMTWDCTVDEKLITTPSLTPAQQKKKERFIRNRQKKMEEEKQKKEAQLEKKQQEEMELLIQMKETEERQTEYRRQQQQQQQQQQRRREQEVVAAQQELHSMQRGIGTAEKSVRKKVEEPSSKVTSMGTPRQSSIPNASEPTDDNIGQNNLFSGYNGPSAYQKPTGKSNRKIIQNAITHCCLSGGVNNDAKVKCLEAMEKSEANHFVVLFRDGMKFRSVYEYYPEDETVTKIYGIGPKTITSKMTDKFYRYYSGGKKFDPLLMKDLSIQCDGLTIKKELWEKKQGTPSKISSNMRKKLR